MKPREFQQQREKLLSNRRAPRSLASSTHHNPMARRSPSERTRKMMMRYLPRWLQGFPTYFLGSGLALAVDFAVLRLCVHLGWPLNLSATLGFLSGMVIAYTISVRFAFTERRLDNAKAEFVSFTLIGVLGLGLTVTLMSAFVGLGLTLVAAKFATSGIVFSFNYLTRKFFLFTRTQAA